MADHAKPALSNPTYDRIKHAAQYWLPATGTFYFTIAQIWELPYAEQVLGTIAALEILLGVVLGLSKKSYNDSGAAFDGAFVLDTSDPVKDVFRLEFDRDLEELEKKDFVTFKMKTDSQV